LEDIGKGPIGDKQRKSKKGPWEKTFGGRNEIRNRVKQKVKT